MIHHIQIDNTKDSKVLCEGSKNLRVEVTCAEGFAISTRSQDHYFVVGQCDFKATGTEYDSKAHPEYQRLRLTIVVK